MYLHYCATAVLDCLWLMNTVYFFIDRNLLYNGMWPTSLWNLGIMVVFLSFAMLYDSSHLQSIKEQLWRIADFLYIPHGKTLDSYNVLFFKIG